ncbi:MAG: tyrosine-protein phosphatase [Ardenticatenaceae bacterium]|nr:tyrosine-protein phosphatase [Ardenticatenaceae bacterium]
MNAFISGLAGFFTVLILAYGFFRLLLWRGSRNVSSVDPATLIQPLPVIAEMTRNAEGDLLVSWHDQLKVREIEVVAEGIKPLKISYPKHQRLQISRPISPRPFATLHIQNNPDDEATTTLTVGERYLPLKKAVNVRDIGGYNTADGRQIKWGQIFRGGDLSRLSNADQRYLQRIGVSLICDLRSNGELNERADVVPEGITYQHMPVNEGHGPLQGHANTLLFDRGGLHQVMCNLYVQMVRDRAPVFGQLLTLLADPANLPLMIHCTAGKDRTGVSIALLMELLGVPKETIIADYTQSNRSFDQLYSAFQLSRGRFSRIGIPVADLKALFQSHPDWLASAWSHIHTRYETIEEYLIAEAGLTSQNIVQIRNNLLQS